MSQLNEKALEAAVEYLRRFGQSPLAKGTVSAYLTALNAEGYVLLDPAETIAGRGYIVTAHEFGDRTGRHLNLFTWADDPETALEFAQRQLDFAGVELHLAEPEALPNALVAEGADGGSV